MDQKNAKNRADKLRSVINDLRYRYHVLDDPTVDDEVYSSLTKELRGIEEEYPDLVTPDSPTQRVGGKAVDKFQKIEHATPMLSMNDAFDDAELYAWEERLKRIEPFKPDYFAELKIDGLAVSLVYQDGLFTTGATRGDGKHGENVTQNLKTIDAIPLSIPLKGRFEVRGEVYLPKAELERVNKERAKAELPLFANTRNAAAGSIRQLDPAVTAARKLSIYIYAIATDVPDLYTHEAEHALAKKLGFRVSARQKRCRNLTEALDFYNAIHTERDRLPHGIDGIVVSVNDKQLFGRLGVVGKAPRGSVAFKFPAEQVTTVVEDIIVRVGRTGALTPTAVLRPVNVAGSTVSRATLHNEDEIKRKDVRIGDTVVIQKAGDIIPEVVEPIKKLRSGQEKAFKMPAVCPVCGTKVVRRAGEAASYCPNKNCPARNRRAIEHFISKGALDIDGLGPQILDQLLSEGVIKDPADLFRLKKEDLLPLERFAEKSAENLIQAIKSRKKIELGRLVYGLGIRHVGSVTAYDIAAKYNLNELKKITADKLLEIPGIGDVVAKSVEEWFRGKENQKLLDKLLRAGVEAELPRTVLKSAKRTVLDGKTFVFTGSLEAMSREEAGDKVRALGGKATSSVSKDTDYVVAGLEPGSKYAKAKKLGIKTISEKEFLDLVK